MASGKYTISTSSMNRLSPFKYVGGKASKLDFILPHLPYREGFLELFGGSGAVLINRSISPVEHYNDADDRASAFFRCLQNPEMFADLQERLLLTPQFKKHIHGMQATSRRWGRC